MQAGAPCTERKRARPTRLRCAVAVFASCFPSSQAAQFASYSHSINLNPRCPAGPKGSASSHGKPRLLQRQVRPHRRHGRPHERPRLFLRRRRVRRRPGPQLQDLRHGRAPRPLLQQRAPDGHPDSPLARRAARPAQRPGEEGGRARALRVLPVHPRNRAAQARLR